MTAKPMIELLLSCTIYIYYAGKSVLEAVQRGPTSLRYCYENLSRTSASSCLFVGTFYAIIFSRSNNSVHWLLWNIFCSHVKLLWSSRLNFFSLTVFKVFKQLNLPSETHLSLCDDEGDIDRARRPWEIVPIGHKIGKPEPLFKELVCPAVRCLLPVICFCTLVRKKQPDLIGN